jgi:hypothetical protein
MFDELSEGEAIGTILGLAIDDDGHCDQCSGGARDLSHH